MEMQKYKCITQELLIDLPSIVEHIEHANDIEPNGCEIAEFDVDNLMLHHRCSMHQRRPLVFLEITTRSSSSSSSFTVTKLIRCTFQCQSCTPTQIFNTRSKLHHHFHRSHPNHLIVAKILMKSRIIATDDLNQAIGSETEEIRYSYCQDFKCAHPDCNLNSKTGTRKEIIAHFNERHRRGENFEASFGESIIPYDPTDIELYVQDNKNAVHQMCLFECQDQDCGKLFESLSAIREHIEKNGHRFMVIYGDLWFMRIQSGQVHAFENK